MQDGRTPAYAASQNGHTKTLALLLSNKADVNAGSKVQRIKVFLDLEIERQRNARLTRGLFTFYQSF